MAGQGIIDMLKGWLKANVHNTENSHLALLSLVCRFHGIDGIAVVIQLVANFKDKSRYLPQSEAGVPVGGDEQ